MALDEPANLVERRAAPQINEEEHLLLVLEGSDCFLDLSTEVVGPMLGSSETTATDG